MYALEKVANCSLSRFGNPYPKLKFKVGSKAGFLGVMQRGKRPTRLRENALPDHLEE